MFNNLQEAQKTIERIEGYGEKITKMEKELLVKAKQYMGLLPSEDKTKPTDDSDVFTLESIADFKDSGLKKKADLTITKLQIGSVLSAYKRCRDMGVQLEAASQHGNTVLFEHLASNARVQQENYLKILGNYASSTYMGKWMSSIHGLGPVVSSMLVAEINPENQRGKQASHLVSFAGMNPNMKWGKGEKRPFNSEIKLALYYFASSQLKFMNNPNNYYGRCILAPHIEDTWRRNINGGYEEAAQRDAEKYSEGTLAWAFVNGCFKSSDVRKIRDLSKKGINEDGVILKKGQEAAYTQSLYKKYMGKPGSGTKMLPPAHMLSRSLRFLSVVFLNHLHEIIVRFELGEESYKHTPYIMTKMGGHDPISYLPPHHECEEYIKANPGRKLDMSKMSPQNLKAWIFGQESVFGNEMNFFNPDELSASDAQELNSYMRQSQERAQQAIERVLYDKGE